MRTWPSKSGNLAVARRPSAWGGLCSPTGRHQAHFYTLVTRDTVDQSFAANRQRFLTEQGYAYEILYEHEVLGA